jgi:hypothetical protein
MSIIIDLMGKGKDIMYIIIMDIHLKNIYKRTHIMDRIVIMDVHIIIVLSNLIKKIKLKTNKNNNVIKNTISLTFLYNKIK